MKAYYINSKKKKKKKSKKKKKKEKSKKRDKNSTNLVPIKSHVQLYCTVVVALLLR